MKTSRYIAAISFLLSLWGCGSLVQEVSPNKIPTTTAKLVVHCFISPQDTALVVYINTPRAVLGTSYVDAGYLPTSSIQNTLVNLSDGNTTVQLAGVGGQYPLYYSIAARKLPIITGRTYTLTVSNPYFPAVTAQCTVPQLVKPTEIQIDSTTILTNGGAQFDPKGPMLTGRLVWQDPAGQPHYYQVNGQTIKQLKAKVTYPQSVPQRDTLVRIDTPLRFEKSTLVDDKAKDGSSFISPKGQTTGNYSYSRYDFPTATLLSYTVVMTLSNVDENYYRYQAAIEQQGQAEDNPFAEPVLIPSNIQNGLGCFGAFNQSSLTVRVR